MAVYLPVEGADAKAHAWREAVVEVERARQEYAASLKATDDPTVARLWLRLWRAERRRDQLVKASV